MFVDRRGLFKLDCPACKWGATVATNVKQQAEAACKSVYAIITDPKLRDCILKRCEKNGKIKCTNKSFCGKTLLGRNNTFLGIRSRTANICVKHFPANTIAYGRVAIHEFAHSCGWDEGDGAGVPGDSGSMNPITG